jgi:hypothetical protein
MDGMLFCLTRSIEKTRSSPYQEMFLSALSIVTTQLLSSFERGVKPPPFGKRG